MLPLKVDTRDQHIMILKYFFKKVTVMAGRKRLKMKTLHLTIALPNYLYYSLANIRQAQYS